MQKILVTVLTLIVFASGCTHLHDEQAAKRATELESTFKGFRDPKGSIYQTMLENNAAVREAVRQRLEQAFALRTEAFLHQLDSVRWDEIQAGLSRTRDARERLNAAITEEVKKVLKQRGVADAELASAQAAKEKALQLASAQSLAEVRWQAKRIVFQDALKAVSNAGTVNNAVIGAIKDQTLAKKVPGQDQTISEILSKEYQSLKAPASMTAENFAALVRDFTYNMFDPSAAPGINIIVLSLSADLAAANHQRAGVEAQYLRRQATTLADFLLVRGLIEQQAQALDDRFKDAAPWTFAPTERPLVTLNRLRTEPVPSTATAAQRAEFNDYKSGAIRGAWEILGAYILATTLDDPELSQLELAARLAEARHDYSIQMSAIAAAEREAVLDRQLQALSRYHAGGVTSEQIANLLRGLQAAGIVWIGSGVN